MATNIFQKEMGVFLKDNFIIAERLDDAFKNKFGGFKVSKKPYDFFGATKRGKFWGAEVKKVKTTRFPFRNIPQHQRDALFELETNNCYGFIFINWRLPRAGKAVWIRYLDYLELENKAKQNNRKSIKAKDFPKHWFLERVTGGWNIPKSHRLRRL